MKPIMEATEIAIPQSKSVYFIHPPESDLMKILENTDLKSNCMEQKPNRANKKYTSSN